MNSFGSNCESDVGAGVNEKSSSELWLLFPQSVEDRDCVAGKTFEIARAQIFFAKLDVIDAGSSRFGDFVEQTLAPGRLISGESRAVRDVVEKAADNHQLQ